MPNTSPKRRPALALGFVPTDAVLRSEEDLQTKMLQNDRISRERWLDGVSVGARPSEPVDSPFLPIVYTANGDTSDQMHAKTEL